MTNIFKGTDTGVADHIADTSDAHDAGAISFVPGSGVAATDVQAAVEEVATDVTGHLSDTSDAHDASAISYAGGTGMSATDVEAAIDELATEKANASDLTAHTGDTSDAHDASAISFVPAGTIAATDVQAAIEEVASEAGGSVASASETVAGIAELATQAETNTGTDDARIVTPLKAATRFLAKAGGVLTGFLTLHADPTSALHAVTKQYADGLVIGGASPASETVAGIAELATQTETDTGTDDARIVTPLKLASRTATDTRAGVVELATDGETQTGTDTARAITPANLSARSATETRSGVMEIATQAETDTGTDDTRAVTPLKLATYSGLGGGSGYRTLVTLGSDVVNATTSFADVTGLSFSVTSGTTYRFYALITYEVNATTTGSIWAINGPAASIISYLVQYFSSATAVAVRCNTAYNSGGVTTASQDTTNQLAIIQGIVHPTSSGTIAMRFASEVAVAGALTAKAGSTLEWF